MLSIIGGFFFFILMLFLVVCLPVMILIGKTFIALKKSNNTRNAGYSTPNGSAPRREPQNQQYHDVIETTCTVIQED